MKNSLYFPHDYNARRDPRIRDLIKVHGQEGYGIYWSVIEALHEEGGWLDVNHENIAYELRINVALADSIINNFKLFKFKGRKFTSERVLKNIHKRELASEQARINAEVRWRKDKCDDNATA